MEEFKKDKSLKSKEEKEKEKKKKEQNPVKGDNMEDDDGDDDDLDKIPDVKDDDIKDPSLKPFYIILKGKTARKVFMSKEKVGIDRIAKIKEKPHPKNAVFMYDKRTNTIRLASERNFALGNKMGKGVKQGHPAVFRRILENKVLGDQLVTMGKKNIKNKAGKCLQVNGKNVEMAPLTWWACNKGNALQHFEKEAKNKDKSKPDFTKQRFLIKLLMKGNRNIYLSKEKQGKDFVLKLGKKPKDWRSWFIMDKRTSTIRLYVQPHLAISNKAGKGVKPGHALTMRKYDKTDESQPFSVNGKRLENAKSKRCLTTMNAENKDSIYLNFWPCSGKEAAKWTREVVPGSYEELCKDEIKKGKRYRLCPGKKPKYLGEHCIRHVETKGKHEVLVKKCGKKTYEIAKCSRYQQKGQWFRKCGKDHLEHVSSGGKNIGL